MPVSSRLGAQIEEIIATLNAMGARFALIGGLALASYKVVRGTSDVDLLTDAATADGIHEQLIQLGYQCLYRSRDVANYLRGDQRVDFLFASRPVAQRLLATASEKGTSFGTLRVISVEGLIAFKLQAGQQSSAYSGPRGHQGASSCQSRHAEHSRSAGIFQTL